MVTKIGPCGGNGGGHRDMNTSGVNRIVRVVIHDGHTIDSVQVLYERNGREEWTDKWGGGGGGRNEIRLSSDEHFTSVRGHVGQFGGHTVVRSLTFVTNHRTFGPYGRTEGSSFELPTSCGRKVVGFHARSGWYLDAFGTYTQ